jgi:hypothetical protein
MSDRLTPAGYKRLYALSENRCAFEGCENPITVREKKTAWLSPPARPRTSAKVVRGLVVGARRVTRSVAACGTTLLPCDFHHKLIDNNPRVYSTGVLQKLKLIMRPKSRAALLSPPIPTASKSR